MASPEAGKKKLSIIFALFLIPLTIAVIWYLTLPDGYKPSRTTNNGNLIEPIYPVKNFKQQTLKGKEYTAKDLETYWTIVHVIDDKCDEACSKVLYNIRQLRAALGREVDRVKRVALIAPDKGIEDDTKMWESHPDLTVLINSGEGDLRDQLKSYTAEANYPANSIYLIDPLNNLMMQFSPDLDPKLVIKDIKKLLKLSRIG